MNNSTKKSYMTMEDYVNNSPFGNAIRAYIEFGYHSAEFKEAELAWKQHRAKVEAEYQIRKAANQAKLYERGY